MAGLVLKEFQREALAAIERFCAAVRQCVDCKALRPVHDANYLETNRDFIDVPQFPGIPYFCLRVPTGGGKTLIAAHAVGAIAKRLGHQDRPLCLWVTPSTTIRDQTLNALRNREHPYHAALRDSLGVPIEVRTMEEALAVNRSMLSSSAVIVVTTIQSYRIRNERGEEDEATRRIYRDNGYLMDHFTNLPDWVRQQLSVGAAGRPDLSLANVMKLRGPIVIMDEAHNARTEISFDSLARFGPLAVLELTATPRQTHDPAAGEYASNVLHAVSALQLKREGIIKLPVELESRENWLDVLAAMKDRRDTLERRARQWGLQSGRFIRPIALVQAQPRRAGRETHTVDKIKQVLVEQLHVPAERIRIATGDKDDLGGEDLSLPDCTVEYVITVDKLREGWDCPFAYVLGSVGNAATPTAVEQLLGRILRMPQATPTGVPELDRAYAIVQSPDVVQTAQNLCDSLVNQCGFDRETVNDAFRVNRQVVQGTLPVATIPVSVSVKTSELPAGLREKVEYDVETKTLQVHAPLTRDETQQLRDSLATPEDREAVEQYWQTERGVGTAAKALDQYALPLRLPQLVVKDKYGAHLFEPEELDEFAWNLNQCDPKLTDADFSLELNVGDRVTVGLSDQGGMRIGGVQEVIVRQLSFVADSDDWSKAELVRWLDADLHRGNTFRGLAKSESQPWLSRVVDDLVQRRQANLPLVVRKRHDLMKSLRGLIAEHGRIQVREAANLLISGASDHVLETTMDRPFELAEQDYCPYRKYSGFPFQFSKHAFDLIGFMNDEEIRCAKEINDHPQVKRWIRNLEQESAGGFSLPLSPGRFFPDFIAELFDGRHALIEYKGRHLAELRAEQHKKSVGDLWAARSAGTCVFVWVVDQDWASVERGLE